MTPAEKLAAAKRSTGDVTAKRAGVPFVCRLEVVRAQLGLTQTEVADAIGMNVVFYGNIERGKSITLTTAIRIARFYGKPVEELWTPTEE